MQIESTSPNSELAKILSSSEWLIKEKGFTITKLNIYESLFTIGNGYLGTRGALEEPYPAAFPATYINGIFDHHDSTMTHMVNAPNWLPFEVMVKKEELNLQHCEVLEHLLILDMRQGLLYRLTRLKDSNNNITRYESIRYAHAVDEHLCELRVAITPENYSGEVKINSSIDGQVFNVDHVQTPTPERIIPGVEWTKWRQSRHLAPVTTKRLADNILYLEVKTIERPYRIGYASTFNVSGDKEQIMTSCNSLQTTHSLQLNATEGETIYFEKMVAIYTSQEKDDAQLADACLQNIKQSSSLSFAARLASHKKAWEQKWHDSDIIIEGDAELNQAVRFSIYHLLIAANDRGDNSSIGAKSMSGEGYRGHVFWDSEIFVLPFYVYTQPAIAKQLLLYRYHTLQGAKKNAKLTGFRGARYSWESTDTGLEETPHKSADGKNQIWPRKEAIHITADVVYGIFTYLTATGDTDFILNYGAEIIFETARFWASRFEYIQKHDRYELHQVIGPDEFHEHVDNSVYTNCLARWNLQKAAEMFYQIQEWDLPAAKKVIAALQLTKNEVNNWREISNKVFILYNPNTKLLEEFDGYLKLEDVSDAYDTQLELSKTKLIKQPDVVALLYILPNEFDAETKRVNYKFYEQHNTHASSLSTSISAIMALRTGDYTQAFKQFKYSAYIDLHDYKSNTDDGIHIAAAGGVWQCAVHGFANLRVKDDVLTFDPCLPKNWRALHFRIKWQGGNICVCIYPSKIELLWCSRHKTAMPVIICGNAYTLCSGAEFSCQF